MSDGRRGMENLIRLCQQFRLGSRRVRPPGRPSKSTQQAHYSNEYYTITL